MRLNLTTKRALAVCAIVMTVATTATAAGAGPAPAAPGATSSAQATDAPSALDACQKGEAPDATQTVFLSGTNGRASYPRGVQPDNAIFPGDVVTVEVTGQLRYNATQWTGPEGTGTPDRNGIRPFAATATWDSLPGGQVGSPMPAVGLNKCTAAPAKYGVRLLYGIKDKVLSDNGGGFTITTRVWRAPGRLTIDRTEVTQGVQNRSGQVALIARKRTFVRVFLRHEHDGSSVMEGVTGTLQVPGIGGVVQPLVNSHITSRTDGGDAKRLEDSLLFEVPRAALEEGARQLVVTVTPPTDRGGGWPIVRHVPVEFGPTTSLSVLALRFSYHNVPQALTEEHADTQPGLNVRPGRWQARSVAAWEPMRRMAENVLPLARLDISDDAPSDPWGSRSFDCEPGQRPSGLRYCDGYKDAMAWAGRVVDRECSDGGCVVVILQPESEFPRGENGVHFWTERRNGVISLQGEKTAAAQGNTLAHEIGHHYGLPHTWVDKHFQDRFATIGDMIGLRYAPTIQLEPGWRLDGHPTYELMSYERPAWFSVFNYCTAMHNLPGRHPSCHPGWDQ
jgi:hypothetical protein